MGQWQVGDVITESGEWTAQVEDLEGGHVTVRFEGPGGTWVGAFDAEARAFPRGSSGLPEGLLEQVRDELLRAEDIRPDEPS